MIRKKKKADPYKFSPGRLKNRSTSSSRSTSATPIFRVPYGNHERSKCNECGVGVMRNTRWNTLVCSNTNGCNHTEII